MRLSYSPFAPLFLYLMQWMDCSSCSYSLPSYLGLLHVLVYKVLFIYFIFLQLFCCLWCSLLLFFYSFEFKKIIMCFAKGITANCKAMLPQYGRANIGKTNQNLVKKFWLYYSNWLMQVSIDGDASITTCERRASIKEFYGTIFNSLDFLIIIL